ncbi:MAG TPA: NADPH-dependent FMN reductase [Acidimicrobiia bacterium]|nr:NADPH-dependent FMN reductase [Acidimicrobiia bacterium]
MPGPCRILLVSGSLRSRSINTAALRTVLAMAPDHVEAILYEHVADLPHFNPDDDLDPLHPAVADLRTTIGAAGAVLFSTPEYAGALPGSFKNLLDWAIGDAQTGSIYEKPVAWINPSPRGAADGVASLRTVLGYAHAEIVEDACVDIPIAPAALGDDGLVADSAIRDRLAAALATLADRTC